MPCLEKEKLCFIHIPKTGGTSIENAMRQIDPNLTFFGGFPDESSLHSPQHSTLTTLETQIPNLDEYQIFAIVRHPYERVVSEFNYQKALNLHPEAVSSFDGFLIQFLSYQPGHIRLFDNHQLPSFFFVCDSTETKIDPRVKIITYRDKMNVVKEVAELLTFESSDIRNKFRSGIERRLFDVGHIHMRVEKLSYIQRQRIAKHFTKDFEHFNFEK